MQSLYFYFKAVFITLCVALLVACKKDDPTPEPKIELCQLEQIVDVNSGIPSVFTYDDQNRLTAVSRSGELVLSFIYTNDTVAETGSLSAEFTSTRSKYVLSKDQRLLKTINESWSPQPGAALISASITEITYAYDNANNLVEIRNSFGSYYLDSISLKPLGKLVLKPNYRTSFFYDSLGNYSAYRKFYINPDGSEWVTNQEDVIDYQEVEVKGTMDISSLWMPILELYTIVPIGKPFRFGNRTPRFFQISGFGLQTRRLNFFLDEKSRAIRLEEESNGDFGSPFTTTTDLTWRCK